ncbi:MAG: hypothetical protein V7604_3437 [Hyphomicrobiales bacterium]
MPQLDPQQLIVLNVIGFLMAAVVWLILVGCTIWYFYLFFVRTCAFAALPDAYSLREALRDRAPIARRGALMLKSGAFVGTGRPVSCRRGRTVLDPAAVDRSWR